LVLEWLASESAHRAFVGVYFVLWGLLACLGARRLWLVRLSRQGGERPFPRGEFERLPRVTVQLPVYNERFVVRRLLQAVGELDYPSDRLEIQLLDDSDDDTTDIAAGEVRRLRERGVDIHHLRRETREGYKAGALAYGTKLARGEFLLILDADFVPRPNLLRETLPFLADSGVGMVQVRWDHLNRNHSLLSRIQAISLDGHFLVDHEARARNGLFFNFNGTAGIWRKSCIEDAGGWHHDTLTEDLDLSWRAQLAGWRFVFLRDVTCPADLPVDMKAFKGQQFRWVKGSVQVAKKLLPRVWNSRLSLARKLEASIHLTQNFAYLLVLILSVVLFPAVLIRYQTGLAFALVVELPLFLLATGSVFVFYRLPLARAPGGWAGKLCDLPLMMGVGIGLSANNSRAIVEGIIGRETPFHRTPKLDPRAPADGIAHESYRGQPSGTVAIELLFAIYFIAISVFVVRHALFASVPFVAVFLFGYLFVGLKSLRRQPS
jgi:cellulose synthase/poly-beta-1,6-N-acetylglucosamine synthase-like glycosyltransferase